MIVYNKNECSFRQEKIEKTIIIDRINMIYMINIILKILSILSKKGATHRPF